MSAPLIQLSSLSKYYVGKQSVVMGLSGVNLTLDRGEFVAITGESGSGKSTLAHILGGILGYEDGEMLINGQPTSHFDSSDWEQYRRDQISFISQSYGILPGATVEENILCALHLSGMEAQEARREADAILEKVDLTAYKKQRAARLSSGQKQRLSIARALAKPAPILIADEPTGNLDPQNSETVIALLKEASLDRLVVLITHEFQEAEGHATRHICIQDGKIVSDMPLQERTIVNRESRHSKAPIPNLGRYVASVQLRSRPVFAAMLLLFLLLTAFAVFSFLGTFIVNLDDNFTRIYDDSAFPNGNDRRIVAVRRDNAPMTQADYDTLLSVEQVLRLERYGYTTDIYCCYREGKDYEKHYSLENVGSKFDSSFVNRESISVNKTDSFLQTVPALPKDVTFLSQGRLPENLYEIVSADANVPLGTALTVYISDGVNWGHNEYIALDVTVVGTTGVGSGLYFHDDIGRMINYFLLCEDDHSFAMYAPYYGKITPVQAFRYVQGANGRWLLSESSEPYTSAEELDENGMRPLCDAEYICSAAFLNLYGDRQPLGAMDRQDPEKNVYVLFPTQLTHDSTLLEYVLVSPENFYRYTPDIISDQVSLTITDYAYAQRVVEELYDLGYNAVSPYQLGTTTPDPELASQRMQTLAVCLAALAAVFLLQAIVLRALFSMETESYKLLSHIGLTSRNAFRSLAWQLGFATVTGQLLGFGGIFLAGSLGISRIVQMLHYLPWTHFLLLSAIHILSVAIAYFWVRRNLKKQVYPLSGRRYDLELEQKEVQL